MESPKSKKAQGSLSAMQSLRSRIELSRKVRSKKVQSMRSPRVFHTRSSDETIAQLPSPQQTSEDDVVLNFENMNKELGLGRRRCPDSSRHDQRGRSREGDLDCLGMKHSRLTADERGQFRFFGYSSSMRVVSVLPPSTPAPTSETSSPPNMFLVSDVDAEYLADSPGIQDHLINAFFQFQSSGLPLLDEHVFREAYAKKERTEYFSKFLLNVILLRAIKYGDTAHPDILARIYLQRAKAELLFEIENPTVSTIPALCLYGYYIASLGSDRACWLYPGMAYRLLFDFGLHEDCQNLIDAGLLTETDRRVRQITLYGCYTLDNSFQGRPTAIRSEDITAPRPTAKNTGPKYKLISAWYDLACLLDEVIGVINGPPERIYQQDAVDRLSKTSVGLVQWFQDLPPELQWDASQMQRSAPDILAIHVQFLTTTILLHRPFAAYMLLSEKKVASRKVCLAGQTPEESQQVCTTNAIRVAKILVSYCRNYGAPKIFATVNPACLCAAIALISSIVSSEDGEPKKVEKKWLAVIVDTLESISQTYPVAGRSRATLAAIMNAYGLSDLLKQPPKSSAEPLPAGREAAGMLLSGPDYTWPMDNEASFGLGFLLDSSYDIHDISLTDFCPHPPQSFEFGNWAPGDLLMGSTAAQNLDYFDSSAQHNEGRM